MQPERRAQEYIEHHGWWKQLDSALRWALGIYLIARVLNSMMRHTLVLFPNAIALALVTRHRWMSGLVTFAFVLLQVMLLGMFIRWIWVA